MRFFEEVSERDPRLSLGVLTAVTVLVLTLHTPQVPEFSAGFSFDVQPPAAQHVMQWYPHGPPPWADADQLSPDEVEEAVIPSGGAAGSSDRGESRARPER